MECETCTHTHTHTGMLEPLETSTSATQTSVPVWEEADDRQGSIWEVPALDSQQVLRHGARC